MYYIVSLLAVEKHCDYSLADSRVKFVKWSIVYFNALLDCPVHLKQYSTHWTGVSLPIATKV